MARRSPARFCSDAREAIVTAFSTAPSRATIPAAMRVAEERLWVPRPVARFVVTLGAVCDHSGPALFEAVAVLFLAQLFGGPLTLGGPLQVPLSCMLSSVGTGGATGGGIVMTVPVMVSIGLPPEAIGTVLGIDRLLDGRRPALNVTGDLVSWPQRGASSATPMSTSHAPTGAR